MEIRHPVGLRRPVYYISDMNMMYLGSKQTLRKFFTHTTYIHTTSLLVDVPHICLH